MANAIVKWVVVINVAPRAIDVKCACDGISPLDALCRRVGKQKKKPQLMTVNVQDYKEASKIEKLLIIKLKTSIFASYENVRKNIIQWSESTWDVTEDSSYIPTKDVTDTVSTLDGGSISTKGPKKVIGTKELSNLRKIHNSEVDTITNSDASTEYNPTTNDRSTTNISEKGNNHRNSTSLPNQTIVGNLAEIDNSTRLWNEMQWSIPNW